MVEQTRLDHHQHLENQKKVQEAYENWKTQKDLEQQLSTSQQTSNNTLLEPNRSNYCAS